MNILLTGAAGMIGGEMASRLCANGHSVVALVRRVRQIRANDGRLLPAVPFSGHLLGGGSITTLTGDVAQADLGLDESILAQLVEKIDMVVHCAAITDFNAAEHVYQNVNVNGTSNVLSLFSQSRFLHVSTAYVCGLKNGEIGEGERDPAFAFTNGYEKSKAAGEAVVRASGNRAVIARPSIIVGEYDNGAIRSFETFYQAFRLMAEGRITKLPASWDATLDFVPIDHVVGGLMDIIAHWDKAAGQTIHLSSGTPIPVSMLIEAIGRFDRLSSPELVHPSEFSIASLPVLEGRLYRHVASFYESYFQHNPRFMNKNLAKLSGRVCPAFDAATLDRMIGYCIDRGLIRTKQVSGYPDNGRPAVHVRPVPTSYQL